MFYVTDWSFRVHGVLCVTARQGIRQNEKTAASGFSL